MTRTSPSHRAALEALPDAPQDAPSVVAAVVPPLLPAAPQAGAERASRAGPAPVGSWTLVGSAATAAVAPAPVSAPFPTRRSLRQQRAAAAPSVFGDLPPLPPTRAPSADGAPVDEAPLDAAPLDAAPVEAVPVQAAPVGAAPVGAAPVGPGPLDAAPPAPVLLDGRPDAAPSAPESPAAPTTAAPLVRPRGRRRAPQPAPRSRRSTVAPTRRRTRAVRPDTPLLDGAQPAARRRRAGARRPALLGPAPGAAGRIAASLLVAGCALVGVGLAPVTAGSVPAPTTALASATGSATAEDVRSSTAASGVDPRPAAGAGAATSTGSAVAVAAPVSVEIPSIGVSSDLVDLGITADGSLEVPEDAAVAGWFTGSARPGAAGPAVLAGHVDSSGGPGVFLDLEDLAPGAEVLVHRADGTTASFTVTGSVEVDKRDFPTDAVYGPTAGAELRLITCDGVFDRSTGHYRDNLVVFATATTA